MKTSDWRGLYRDDWRGEITPDAFTHPAKYARGLIRRIYEHAQSEGWVRPGDGVVDPFGGVALGGLDAMRLGLHWTGVELEPRFAELGNANIALWNSRYQGRFAKWGTARLLNGDSRNLGEILTGWQTLAVSSPPYASSDQDYAAGWAHFHSNGREPKQTLDRQREAHYGRTPGQLAAMPAGKFDLAVSSPPYADGSRQEGNDRHPERMEGTAHTPARYDLAVSSPPFSPAGSQMVAGHQGDRAQYAANGGKPEQDFSTGNLADLPMRAFDLAVSSPPWDEGAPPIAPERVRTSHSPKDHGSAGPAYQAMPVMADFWTAARAIVEQTYSVLTPGAHACWVVKDFVRDGQRVEFSDQWRQLCEAVGFTTLHLHRAWVVEHHGTQKGLDGPDKEHRVERKSFFRRLAEKKGSPRIDWETVYCMEKSA